MNSKSENTYLEMRSTPYMEIDDAVHIGSLVFPKIIFLEKEYIDFTEACRSLGVHLGAQVRWVKRRDLGYRVVHRRRLLAVEGLLMWLTFMRTSKVCEEHRQDIVDLSRHVLDQMKASGATHNAMDLLGIVMSQPNPPRPNLRVIR